MKTSLLLLASFATLALSAPSKSSIQSDPSSWSPALAEFYYTVDKHIQAARSLPNYPNPPPCDLSMATMPVAPTPLPGPPEGSSLMHVAIGRGVQNYTCADSLNSTKPAAVGALANLYNASCIAAYYPDLLYLLPTLALEIPFPVSPAATMEPARIDLSGFHFFSTNTTPVFNLEANPLSDLGIAVGKKMANSTAPTDSVKGVNGIGNGAVAWLYLTTTNSTIGDLTSVYRLNTAGGSPPKTCLNMPATFSVQYAAEYWFWGQ